MIKFVIHGFFVLKLKIKLSLFLIILAQFSLNIKGIQIDNGSEFVALSTLVKQYGIIYRFTCPHTSQQNGAVECCHRRIVDKGLALLHQSYFAFFFLVFCYVYFYLSH